jgi:hypothetical protein
MMDEKQRDPAVEIRKHERMLERLLFQRESKEETIAEILIAIDAINEEIEQVESDLKYWMRLANDE